MYRLHGFCQSGNTFKVAFALRALNQEWEPVFVDYMQGATKTSKWRAQMNEMGEVPILETPEGERMTQSGAILLYLATKYGSLLGRDDAQRYQVLRWLFFDNHKFTSYFATWRYMKSFGEHAPKPQVGEFLLDRINENLGIVEKHLAHNQWIVGSEPTIADISMCAYLLFPPEEHGFRFENSHPHIAAWLARVQGIPGYAHPYKILPGKRMLPRW